MLFLILVHLLHSFRKQFGIFEILNYEDSRALPFIFYSMVLEAVIPPKIPGF